MTDNNKKTALKLYNVEMSFVRPYQETGVFSCAAENEEAAKVHMQELFKAHPELNITRVYLVEDCPQLYDMLPPQMRGPIVEAEEADDDDNDPTIN